ncbi:MAG TPA: winged helix-turn-helix domain-containing protein [Solirubrobacterales bacterium]
MPTATKREAAQRQEEQNLHKALSHPLRSEILTLLNTQTASASDLARTLDATVGDVTYHLRKLEGFGFAEEVSSRPVRGATEHFFRATTRNFVALRTAQEMHPAVADHYAGQVMQVVLDDFLRAADKGSLKTQELLHLTNTPLALTPERYESLMERLEAFRVEIEEETARSAEELAQTGEPSIPVSFSMLCFKLPGG